MTLSSNGLLATKVIITYHLISTNIQVICVHAWAGHPFLFHTMVHTVSQFLKHANWILIAVTRKMNDNLEGDFSADIPLVESIINCMRQVEASVSEHKHISSDKIKR